MRHEGLKKVDYSITDDALNELANRYATIPDTFTKDGYKEAKAALSVLVKYRTDVEKKRKELKADALEYGRIVDGEAKRITAKLEAIEDPIRHAKEKKDQYDAEKERERIETIKAKIYKFRSFTDELIGSDETLEKLSDGFERVKKAQITEAIFSEFIEEADNEKQIALSRLTKAIEDKKKRIADDERNKIERERLEKERAEFEARQKEEAEQRRKEQEAIQAERRELERLRKEKEAREREVDELLRRESERERDIKEEIRKKEAIEEAARGTVESIAHHEASFDEPRAPEAIKRFVFHLSLVGDEFHCETFLGSIVTKDKAELMLLIEGAIGEVMTCVE